MKPRVISAEALFEEHQPALRWEWVAGHAHPERRFDEAAVREACPAADLIGYLNPSIRAGCSWSGIARSPTSRTPITK